MVNLYVKKIIDKSITINKVPSIWRNKVIEALKEKAAAGQITEEDLEKYLNGEDFNNPTEG